MRLPVERPSSAPASLFDTNEAAIALHRLALDSSGLAMAQMKKAGVIKRLTELLTAGEEGPAYASALAIESYVMTDEEARHRVQHEA